MQRALDHILLINAHVVAQVVEAELVVRAVGDVRLIRLSALVRIEIVNDAADVQTQKPVDLAHPLRVALCKVIVDGDDVHALAFQRVQVCGQRRNERFTLAGLHLGDSSLMQNHAAQQLHIEVPHADGSDARFAYDRERLDHEVVKRLAVFQAFPEFDGLVPQLFVGEFFHFRLERVDRRHLGPEFLQFAFARRSEQLVQKSHKNLLERYL